jgi:hypothetical protein
MLKKFDKQSGGHAGFDTEADYRWRILFVAGMWFQDLFNYDFRRTEMCIIPYATQMGEISFCAYNTGVGWRQIIEHMHKNASTAEWYKKHGKHAVYANGKDLRLPMYSDPITSRIPVTSAGPGRADSRLPVVQEVPVSVGGGCGSGCGCS